MENESDLEVVELERFQCRHIFTDGHRCGSPALRAENFCYFHHTSRRVADPRRTRTETGTLKLTMPEDRTALLLSIGQVLQGLADRTLDRKDAGLMLYGLQVANSALPREPHTGTGPARANSRTQPRLGIRGRPAPGDHEKLSPVEDTVFEEDLGILAHPAEYLEPEEKYERKSLGRRMLEELEEYEERQREHQREEEMKEAISNAQRETYANIQEVVESAKAVAIAETEARLRAEFNLPSPETLPTIQAVADLLPERHLDRPPLNRHLDRPTGVERPPHSAPIQSGRKRRANHPVLRIARQRRTDIRKRRTDLGSQALDRRNRAQPHQGCNESVFNQVLAGFVFKQLPCHLAATVFGSDVHGPTYLKESRKSIRDRTLR